MIQFNEDNDRLAQEYGCVTSATAEVGAIVTRSSDWSRQNEDCDAGLVVGYLDSSGVKHGEIPQINLRPYSKHNINRNLCAVKWATNDILVSSIGMQS
jgi:hypothetical protein